MRPITVTLPYLPLTNNAARRHRFFCRLAGALCLGASCLAVSGCLGDGLALQLGPAPDRGIISGSIGDTPTLPSDDDIIRDAVAQADVKTGPWQDIEWNHPGTGDGGVISYIKEKRSARSICRSFITSKHSYDGIAQYTGEICRARMGREWTLKSIEQQG